MKQLILFAIILILPCLSAYVEAATLKFEERLSYGIIKYEEEGDDVAGESILKTFVLGLSGEYMFPATRKFFAGVAGEWTWGMEDEETWERNSIDVQKNDLRIFGQSYDLRFGYRDSFGGFNYSLYISGGWDGIHFERDNFDLMRTTIRNEVTEDFSLLRTGTGLCLGYGAGDWAMEGRAAYAFYPEGEGTNSALKDIEYDTEGERFDASVGVTHEIMQNLSLNLSGSYTFYRLEIQKLKNKVTQTDSEIHIITGTLRLTYAF